MKGGQVHERFSGSSRVSHGDLSSPLSQAPQIKSSSSMGQRDLLSILGPSASSSVNPSPRYACTSVPYPPNPFSPSSSESLFGLLASSMHHNGSLPNAVSTQLVAHALFEQLIPVPNSVSEPSKRHSSVDSEASPGDYKVRGGKALGVNLGSDSGNSSQDFKVRNGSRWVEVSSRTLHLPHSPVMSPLTLDLPHSSVMSGPLRSRARAFKTPQEPSDHPWEGWNLSQPRMAITLPHPPSSCSQCPTTFMRTLYRPESPEGAARGEGGRGGPVRWLGLKKSLELVQLLRCFLPVCQDRALHLPHWLPSDSLSCRSRLTSARAPASPSSACSRMSYRQESRRYSEQGAFLGEATAMALQHQCLQ